MTTSIKQRQAEVASALCDYLGIADAKLHQQELRRDLGLEPLDLVLLVLRFEESDGVAFPFEELENVTTVEQLVQRVADWLAGQDYARRLADEQDGFGKESGKWPASGRMSDKSKTA